MIGTTAPGAVANGRVGRATPRRLATRWADRKASGRSAIARVAFVSCAAAFVLGGCATTRESEAEVEAEAIRLSPAGWIDPSVGLDAGTFDGYADAVRAVLERHRVPFSAATATLELGVAAPAEYAPVARCGPGEPEGIAILVHGLSDTAFALADVGRALAERCWAARAMLLPGHGTRAGDLLIVDHHDWLDAVRRLVEQAAAESERVAVVGFSLGAVLGTSIALEPGSPVGAVVAISPAYHLSSWPLARWAPWLVWAKPWIDRGAPDDYARYEAMPTRGIAETVRAVRHLRAQLRAASDVAVPWLLVQSLDDAVTSPFDNIALHGALATSPASRVLAFLSDGEPTIPHPSITWLRGDDEASRVQGLTHQAVHLSPDNPHYGPGGDYRNCALGAPGPIEDKERCLGAESDALHYGLWNRDPPPGVPVARGTFNPRFDAVVGEIGAFLGDIE